jgi:mannose-6-phosphate isomerase-like protein (cupin superfamily)
MSDSGARDAMTERLLPVRADALAPDGSFVRILVSTTRGSMAHFELGAGETSVAHRHRTVEEVWFVTEGLGEMWREPADGPARVIELRPGVSLTIPIGTPFQFRNTGRVPLGAVGVTMPPWPGVTEAVEVEGPWTATVRNDPGTWPPPPRM